MIGGIHWVEQPQPQRLVSPHTQAKRALNAPFEQAIKRSALPLARRCSARRQSIHMLQRDYINKSKMSSLGDILLNKYCTRSLFNKRIDCCTKEYLSLFRLKEGILKRLLKYIWPACACSYCWLPGRGVLQVVQCSWNNF